MISLRSKLRPITAARGSLAGIGAALLLMAVSGNAAQVGDVVKTSDQWLVAQVDSQKRVNALADERGDLANDYRTTLRESEGLKLYLQQLRSQIASQSEEMEVIRKESAELDRTNIEIQPLMVRMLGSLAQFVSLDLPFLPEERQGRVAKLQEMMPRADVTVSEKYRRIVEAYQIEMDYGRTIEAYRGELDGKTVDFLRVGRVGLMYQTPDGASTGYWDASKKSWVADNDYAHGVKEGLKVARKQTSPNLLVVPVQAALKGSK